MSFSNRVATVATIAFGILALIGGTAPGFAQDIAQSVVVPSMTVSAVNVPAPARVPSAPRLDIPATTPVSLTATATLQPGDTIAFGTLAAAVAAQSMPDTPGDDLSCMAGAVYYEAKGEPLSGQLAVAEVILNRARSGRFPRSVCSVVTQPGQFSFVRGGRVPAVSGNAAYRTAVAVAQVALADAWDSPASDAMYFHARRVSPGWRRTQIAAIGNHIFYR